MVKLPAQALAQLAQLRATQIADGEIFWLPTDLVVYFESDREDRPCLVVATDAARAHLVAGTTKRARGPSVVVAPGETDLPKRTRFDFWRPFTLPLITLANQGRSAGCLHDARWPDVIEAVGKSGHVALKRVVRQ